ncbi:ATP-grasp domain-containing protein [Aquibacillus salsiterrae]|uniref:RimK family alpha-L-glutamate ligase n=1 Tax=Aquibacillus salsiterrae TaxID=2950439 RepID=A0A9X3WD24_9BACI|nr:RimK family alpha-L-glutamate ligase [Aquibacillus salsiterrae]MDC3417620.1 RimK family alpha-L-glutamate ligase [Aquibacillus salsiterrae]
MLGWLVIHHQKTAERFTANFDLLQQAAKCRGIDLIIKTDKELFYLLNNGEDLQDTPDFVIFWDSDMYLARYLETIGIPLFNCAEAIEGTVNKAITHIKLHKKKIKMPRTIIAPRDINVSDHVQQEFLIKVVKAFAFPIILKGCFGSFGNQVFLANNDEQLLSLTRQFNFQPFLYQEFIESSRGRDVRINVVGDKCVAAMYRYSGNDDFRANVAVGGKVEKYEPSAKEKDIAIRACQALNLDFAGVDLLFDEDGDPIVCEVNSSALIKTISELTGVNVASHIIEHIEKKF